MAAFAAETPEDGRARLVRRGYLPVREAMTGTGPVPGPVSSTRVLNSAAVCAAAITPICGHVPSVSVKFCPFQNLRKRQVFDRVPTAS